MLHTNPNAPTVLDDAEQVLHDARESIRKTMEFFAADAIENRRVLKKESLEIILEAITEEMAEEGNVKWAKGVAREHASDATFYPDSGLCDDLAEQMKEAFREKAGEDFATSLFNAMKPPTREQKESWRNPPTNPATTGRMAVRSGDGVQFIEFGE